MAQTLVARIEDNGRHFDPTQVPPPSVATSLDDAKIGDLGHSSHAQFCQSAWITNGETVAIG